MSVTVTIAAETAGELAIKIIDLRSILAMPTAGQSTIEPKGNGATVVQHPAVIAEPVKQPKRGPGRPKKDDPKPQPAPIEGEMVQEDAPADTTAPVVYDAAAVRNMLMDYISDAKTASTDPKVNQSDLMKALAKEILNAFGVEKITQLLEKTDDFPAIVALIDEKHQALPK